jgi:hypothetical protein
MRRPAYRHFTLRVLLPLTLALSAVSLRAAENDGGQKPKDKESKNAAGAKGTASDGNGQPKPPKLTGEQKSLLRVKEVLQAGDEEWAVLESRIAAVMRLQRDVSAGKDQRGPRPPRPEKPSDNPAANPSERPTTDVQTQARALNAALFDPSLPASEIKARVAAVRDARTRVRQDLARAQDELRELLTYRQEATLIIMGLLE